MAEHYNDVTMCAMVSQITSLTVVDSIVYSGADQRKHQSSASLAFGRGIHLWPVNSPHTGPVTRKMLLFDDVIMTCDETCDESFVWPTTFPFQWMVFFSSIPCAAGHRRNQWWRICASPGRVTSLGKMSKTFIKFSLKSIKTALLTHF